MSLHCHYPSLQWLRWAWLHTREASQETLKKTDIRPETKIRLQSVVERNLQVIDGFLMDIDLGQFELKNSHVREQRSSSEDSIIKLLQSSPVIYESEDDDAMAISAEAYEKMQKYKIKEETSDSEELLCFTAEVKVGKFWLVPLMLKMW